MYIRQAFYIFKNTNQQLTLKACIEQYIKAINFEFFKWISVEETGEFAISSSFDHFSFNRINKEFQETQ